MCAHILVRPRDKTEISYRSTWFVLTRWNRTMCMCVCVRNFYGYAISSTLVFFLFVIFVNVIRLPGFFFCSGEMFRFGVVIYVYESLTIFREGTIKYAFWCLSCLSQITSYYIIFFGYLIFLCSPRLQTMGKRSKFKKIHFCMYSRVR